MHIKCRYSQHCITTKMNSFRTSRYSEYNLNLHYYITLQNVRTNVPPNQ